MRDGPAAGLALIEAILARGELADYHLAHAARADLCRRLNRTDEARIPTSARWNSRGRNPSGGFSNGGLPNWRIERRTFPESLLSVITFCLHFPGFVMPPIISVSHLTKTYASGFRALNDISLDIRHGEIFALLGPNGAGKTTLISIVCGIVTATQGTVSRGRATTSCATTARPAPGSDWCRRS